MPSMTRDDVNRVLAEFMGFTQCSPDDILRWLPRHTGADWAGNLNLLLGKDGVWARMSEEERQRAHRIHFRSITGLEPVGAYAIMLNAVVEHGPEPLARACAEAVTEGEHRGNTVPETTR